VIVNFNFKKITNLFESIQFIWKKIKRKRSKSHSTLKNTFKTQNQMLKRKTNL